MPNETTPDIDRTEDDLVYQLAVLKLMFRQLPENICVLLSEQLSKVMHCVLEKVKSSSVKMEGLGAHITDELEQIASKVNYMQFDLEATRRERDDYYNRLKDHNNGPE